MANNALIICADPEKAGELADEVRAKGYDVSVVNPSRWSLLQGDIPSCRIGVMAKADKQIESDLKSVGAKIIKDVSKLNSPELEEVDETLAPAPIPPGTGIGTAEDFKTNSGASKKTKAKSK